MMKLMQIFALILATLWTLQTSSAASIEKKNYPSQSWKTTHNGKSYFIAADMKVNWFGALHYCHSIGMELTSIETYDEHSFLVFQIFEKKARDAYWISGNSLQYNDVNKMYWENTGKRMQYTKWAEGAPFMNVHGENCVHLNYDGWAGWNNDNCNLKLPFICRKKLDLSKGFEYNWLFHGKASKMSESK